MSIVSVLATGGTIASRSGTGGAVAQDTGNDLVAGLDLPEEVEVRVRDVVRVGGFRMTLAHVHEVARAVAAQLLHSPVGVQATHSLCGAAYAVSETGPGIGRCWPPIGGGGADAV